MKPVNTIRHVPAGAEERLAELADILARGVLRGEAKKTGFGGGNRLDLSSETRLTVTTSAAEEHTSEVT